MAVIRSTDTSTYKSIQYSFINHDDKGIDELLKELKEVFLPRIKTGFKPKLQLVIDHIELFQKKTSIRQRLSVTIMRENTSYAPTVTVKAQTVKHSVISKKDTAIFVLYNKALEQEPEVVG